jgi:hypothetical protein
MTFSLLYNIDIASLAMCLKEIIMAARESHRASSFLRANSLGEA